MMKPNAALFALLVISAAAVAAPSSTDDDETVATLPPAQLTPPPAVPVYPDYTQPPFDLSCWANDGVCRTSCPETLKADGGNPYTCWLDKLQTWNAAYTNNGTARACHMTPSGFPAVNCYYECPGLATVSILQQECAVAAPPKPAPDPVIF